MIRFHRILLVVSVLVPVLVFAAAAAWNRAEVLREDREAIARTAAVLHEHARKVFDTVELLLGRVDDRVRALAWNDGTAAGASAFLRDLKTPLDQAVSIWVTDAEGRVRAGSQPWDPAVSFVDRDYFAIHRERADAGTYVSGAFSGRNTGRASFAVSRRRSTPDGGFDGTIHVSLSPDYFSRFFAEAAPAGPSYAALMRDDGEILARAPQRAANARVAPDSPLMQAMRARPEGGEVTGTSVVDGRERHFAYRRVAPYPLYVSFAVDQDVMLARWRRNVALYGLVALLAASTLFAVSWLALRHARAEQAALVGLRRESEQRLAAEQRLFQAQKMESLGQLTGGIAHDFNNLLAVVIGNLDLLRKRVTDERARRFVENALQGAQRGAVLTQRLLAFARRQDLAPRAVDLPALVAGMTDLLGRSLGPGMRLAIDFPAGLGPVRADPGQLELAILNLAVNARDAMPDGGAIGFSARREDVGEGERPDLGPGRYVRLAVSDTGVGMDAATLARAVEPFFTTKDVGKGTGLGLSMIHGFAVQSGGAMRLTSQPGRGTTVELWLPEGGPDLVVLSPGAAPAASEPAPGRGRTVLLVEDDPLVMAGTSAMLEDAGHRVIEAGSGEAALEILGTGAAVDLVVTDYAMPFMTGLELAERVRRDRPRLPILLASGHAELPERAGLDLHRVAKPFRQDELAGAVAAALEAPEGRAAGEAVQSSGP